MVLPVMPLCLDVVKMATRCIYLGTGLPTTVVWRLTDAISTATAEIELATSRDGLYCDIYEDLPADEEGHPTPLF